jgi:flagellin-like protein
MASHDKAVSPVVGVLLMLVVTIIIAAVVSGFAGGLISNSKKAPDASFKVKITNPGTWGGSQYQIDLLSSSEPIDTKNLKIINSWATESASNTTTIIPFDGKNHASYPYGGSTNVYYKTPPQDLGNGNYHSPLGFNVGVDVYNTTGNYGQDIFFGNYTLTAGSVMKTGAYGFTSTYGGYGVTGSTRYQYTSGTTYTAGTSIDGMQAMLGSNWNALRPGDIVKVKIVYVPSGSPIFEKDVKVEG